MFDALVISISNPLKVGIYKDEILIKSYEKEGKTSDILPSLFNDILNEYELNSIIYVNTPGSYMAIKVAYVFLKTICITKDIKLLAVSGFKFNKNSPIKALGKKYFFNENGNTIMKFLGETDIIRDFNLPKTIKRSEFSLETLPIYNLPAV